MICCPRCLYSFYPPRLLKRLHEGVLAHECVTGYIKPMPQTKCSACIGLNDETTLMTHDAIVEFNRTLKARILKQLENEKERSRDLVKLLA